MPTIEELQAAAAAAKTNYQERRAQFEQAQEQLNAALLAMEAAWCRLFEVRWQLARAQGIDPVTICFQED